MTDHGRPLGRRLPTDDTNARAAAAMDFFLDNRAVISARFQALRCTPPPMRNLSEVRKAYEAVRELEEMDEVMP